jgi:hypothetical protein
MPCESAEARVRFLPTRPTNQPPLDFVWREGEGEEGQLVGFPGVIASVVDVPVVPESVRSLLMTPEQSSAAGVRFATIAAPTAGVLFKRQSDSYGRDAVDEARRVAALKRAVFEGTACGHVYATTWSGKFSDGFGGGPWRQQGLNCSMTKPRL